MFLMESCWKEPVAKQDYLSFVVDWHIHPLG